MPRSVRIQYPGAVYHVMCRGDRREANCHLPSPAPTVVGAGCLRKSLAMAEEKKYLRTDVASDPPLERTGVAALVTEPDDRCARLCCTGIPSTRNI